MCLSHIGAFWPASPGPVPGAVEDLAVAQRERGLVCCSELPRLNRETRGGQEPVDQSWDKSLFHDYRERLKLLRAYITSREVMQHDAAIPTKPSPRSPRPSRSLSAQKYLTCYYSLHPQPPLIVNPSSRRNATRFRRCDFVGIIFCSLSVYSLKLCAVRSRGAESGRFRSVLFMFIFRIMLPGAGVRQLTYLSLTYA